MPYLRTNMSRWRIVALAAWPVSLAVIGLVAGFLGAPRVDAQVSWPTPPPAPIGFFPEVIPASEITAVPAPGSPGSIAVQVDPIFAGPMPRIPPRASTLIATIEPDAADRVTLHFDAGSIDRTIQLTYEPLRLGLVPVSGPGAQIQRAFRIQIYDHTGAPLDLSFRFPVRIVVGYRDSDRAYVSGDPARLLLARYDPVREWWQPLVTTLRPADGTLLARVLEPGLFAVIALPDPISS